MKWFMKRASVLAIVLFLSSCGFHLRTPATLSPALQRPYIETKTPFSPLTRHLEKSFERSGATPADTRETASAVFVILGEQQSQTLLSVSSTQSSRQYRLSLSITFLVTDTNGRVRIKPQTLTESRILTMASSQILSSSNETQVLYQQIRFDLVQAIMNRLASREISAMLTQSKHHARR